LLIETRCSHQVSWNSFKSFKSKDEKSQEHDDVIKPYKIRTVEKCLLVST